MAVFDLSPYAVGGATRPDTFSGLDPRFQASLEALFQNAPEDIRSNLRILSGFRSPEVQSRLFSDAVAKYGSPQAARKYVAPPGHSEHNSGHAVDFRFLDDAAKNYVHENAGKYGLTFPMSWEPWHIEPIGARGGPQKPGTPAPALPPAKNVADLPVAEAKEPMPSAVPTPPAEQKGGIGAVLASLAPAFASGMASGGGMGAPAAPIASFGSGDPMGATMAAAQMAQKARGLPSALMPDADALASLGKRPVTVG